MNTHICFPLNINDLFPKGWARNWEWGTQKELYGGVIIKIHYMYENSKKKKNKYTF